MKRRINRLLSALLCCALLLALVPSLPVPQAEAADPWVNNADVSWIDPSKKLVAITFDDGPVATSAAQTNPPSQRILNVIEKYQLHVTFFYWGEKINDYNLNSEIKRAYALGCELGNHTFTHQYPSNNANTVKQELQKVNDILEPISGNAVTVIRPPYGNVNNTLANNAGAPLINWSLDSGDWNNGNYNSVLNQLRNIQDGDIVLCHQTYDFTAQAFETIVPELIAKGFQVVTVSELMKMKNVTFTAGTTYTNQARNRKNIETTFANIGIAEDMIREIGEVTLEKAAAIESARTFYDALTASQKERVTNYSDLTAAEATLEELNAIDPAVEAVVAAIDAIGEVSVDSAAAIASARSAYDALTDAQKAKVTNDSTLTDAEAALKAILDAIEKEKAEIQAVIDAIAAIGEVTEESAAAIESARSAYDALTDAQKASVTNYPTLTAAEDALEALRNYIPFDDVSGWYEDAVRYVYRLGLMNGTSAGVFSPKGSVTRAQLVTILYRAEGEPEAEGASQFTDVPAGQWYSDAVAWAAANGIVNGMSETLFGPMKKITREQIAAILYRYSAAPEAEGSLEAFPDAGRVSPWAVDALRWAVGEELIAGIQAADGTVSLNPAANATRAQIAVIVMRYLSGSEPG